VYSDSDTLCLRPIDNWIADASQRKGLIVGLEGFGSDDERNKFGWADNVQFCQWTIAAVPNHPVLQRVISLIIDRVANEENGIPLGAPNGIVSVIMRTGPGVWTEALVDYLTAHGSNASALTDGKRHVVGDSLILPVSAFGPEQPHSGSQKIGHPDVLVQHLWRSSWHRSVFSRR